MTRFICYVHRQSQQNDSCWNGTSVARFWKLELNARCMQRKFWHLSSLHMCIFHQHFVRVCSPARLWNFWARKENRLEWTYPTAEEWAFGLSPAEKQHWYFLWNLNKFILEKFLLPHWPLCSYHSRIHGYVCLTFTRCIFLYAVEKKITFCVGYLHTNLFLKLMARYKISVLWCVTV